MKKHKSIAAVCSALLLLSSAAVCNNEITAENVFAAEILEFHIDMNDEYTVTGCDKSAEIVEIPSSVNGKPVSTISAGAFEECTLLKSVTIPESIKTIGEKAFENCTNLKSVILPNGLKRIEFSMFEDCAQLSSVSIPDTVEYIGECAFYNCTDLIEVNIPDKVTKIKDMAFCNCKKLSHIIIPESVTEISENAFTGCDGLHTVDIQSDNSDIAELFSNNPDIEEIRYVRPEISYEICRTSSPVNISARSNTISLDKIDVSSYTSDTTYNNGFGYGERRDPIQEFKMSNGENCTVVNLGKSAAVAFSDGTKSFYVDGNYWTFGGAGIDESDNIYILWGQSYSDNDLLSVTDANTLRLCKYDKNGTLHVARDYPLKLTNAQFPFTSGNAAIGIKDGILLAVYNTVWTKSENGMHHQGSAFIAANLNDHFKITANNNWQGSHSFGISMIPADDGFSLIQLGDAESARGINISKYTIENGEVKDDLLNGKRLIYHASGQYGTNENFLDGNDTFTHLGGIAHSISTYAVAGKSERTFTDEVHNISDYADNNYDVFVRIFDGSLINGSFPEFEGEDRINAATGEIVDSNVIWLTDCDSEKQAGAVKIAALDDGSYCVLWEQFVNGSFDSVHYTILDRFGNTLRPESIIRNARLSDNSTQPVVNGYSLKWAVTDAESHSLTWYYADLKSTESDIIILGDVTLDTQIDSRDASAVLAYYAAVSANHAPTLNENQLLAADVNNDDFIDARDASAILSYYAFSSTGGSASLTEFLAD